MIKWLFVTVSATLIIHVLVYSKKGVTVLSFVYLHFLYNQ